NVTVDGTVSGGTDGIWADGFGDLVVTVQNGGDTITGNGGSGIVAKDLGGGKVTVNNNANVTGKNGYGIDAEALGGAVLVNNNFGSAYNAQTISGTIGGIKAITTGAGTVTVQSYNGGGTVTTVAGRAIDAESGSGKVTVDFWGGTLHGTTDGIFASTTGDISIGTIGSFGSSIFGAITGPTGAGSAGIDAEGGSGSIKIRYTNYFSPGMTMP